MDNSNTSSEHESCAGGCKGAGPLGELREQDRFLPIAVVDRLMKSVDNGSTPYKISVGARQCMQECASELIIFVTMAAKERCKTNTIRSDDIVETMESLGFDQYVPEVKTCLKRSRETKK